MYTIERNRDHESVPEEVKVKHNDEVYLTMKLLAIYPEYRSSDK